MRLSVETVVRRVIVTAPRSVSVAAAAWSSSVPTAIWARLLSMDDEFDVLAVEMSGLPETIGVEERTGRLHRPALATAD